MGLFSKPEVVIAKESSNAKEYLRQLEELAEKAAGENAKKIAKETKTNLLLFPRYHSF